MWFRGLRKGLSIQIVYLYHWCCHYIYLVNKPWVPAKSVHFEDICMHCLWTIQCLWDRNYNAYTFLASSATSLNQSLDSNAAFFSIFLLIPLLKIRPFFATCYFFLQPTCGCQLLSPQRLTEKRTTKSFCTFSVLLQHKIWFKIWVIFLTVSKRKISWLSGAHDKYVFTSMLKCLLTGSRR